MDELSGPEEWEEGPPRENHYRGRELADVFRKALPAGAQIKAYGVNLVYTLPGEEGFHVVGSTSGNGPHLKEMMHRCTEPSVMVMGDLLEGAKKLTDMIKSGAEFEVTLDRADPAGDATVGAGETGGTPKNGWDTEKEVNENAEPEIIEAFAPIRGALLKCRQIEAGMMVVTAIGRPAGQENGIMTCTVAWGEDGKSRGGANALCNIMHERVNDFVAKMCGHAGDQTVQSPVTEEP